MSFLVHFKDLSAHDRIQVQGIKPDKIKKKHFRISNW